MIRKKKIPPTKSLKISSAKKITLEPISEELDNNLKNICSSSSEATESEDWKKYLKFSSDTEDDAFSGKKTQ